MRSKKAEVHHHLPKMWQRVVSVPQHKDDGRSGIVQMQNLQSAAREKALTLPRKQKKGEIEEAGGKPPAFFALKFVDLNKEMWYNRRW